MKINKATVFPSPYLLWVILLEDLHAFFQLRILMILDK